MTKRRTDQETIERALNRVENMVSDQYSPDRANHQETSIVPRYSSVRACRRRHPPAFSFTRRSRPPSFWPDLPGIGPNREDQG